MNNQEAAHSALVLESRMQSLINQGYALMNEMATPPSDAYATVLSLVWTQDELAEMPVSLRIMQQALTDIQKQCPHLKARIFPQEPQDGI